MSADKLLINGGAGFFWMIWTGNSPPGNVILRAELQEGQTTFVISCQNKAARSGGVEGGGGVGSAFHAPPPVCHLCRQLWAFAAAPASCQDRYWPGRVKPRPGAPGDSASRGCF